jgi:hypothetical protein
MFPLAVAILLQTRFAAPDAGLATAALASPRPRECRASAVGEAGVWSRLRSADAQRYCDLLARGYARLRSAPVEALSAGQAALALAGPLPAVHVLIGRAQLALGQGPSAYQELLAAETEDAQALVDPKALHAYARAASLAGKPAESVRLYRLLASRVALLDDAREVAFVQIEAAAHVLAYAPAGTDEALGYLAQARRESLGLAAWIEGLRLVALQRGGHADASASKADLPSAAALSAPSAAVPLLPEGMLAAVRAALTEPRPRKAKER